MQNVSDLEIAEEDEILNSLAGVANRKRQEQSCYGLLADDFCHEVQYNEFNCLLV